MSEENTLTEGDYNMVIYFWQEKGDITRWSSWEEKKPLFEKYHPELIKAMNDWTLAEKMLNLVIDSLSGLGN